jgi:dipeptidyl aminopeptidase/acylaminoacyl peptidase
MFDQLKSYSGLLGLVLCFSLVGCATNSSVVDATTNADAKTDDAKTGDGAMPADATPAPTAAKPYSIQTLMSNLRLSGAAISPDGERVLFSSNKTGVQNLYEISIHGGQPTALTQSKQESIYAIDYFPNDNRVLYSADQGGNELAHVYVREVDGSSKDLTPGDKHRASFFGFADDDQSFFVISNERDPRYFDVYEYAVNGYQRKLFFKNDLGMQPGAISRDKRYVVLAKSITTSNSDLYLVDRNTGKSRLLTEHTGVEINRPVTFTPDGKLLMTTSRQTTYRPSGKTTQAVATDGDFTRLIALDLPTGHRREIFATDWDVTGAQYSPDNTQLLIYVNADARTQLHLLDVNRDYAPLALPKAPDGDITGVSFSKNGKRLAFYVASSRTPSALWSATETGDPKELVSALNTEINPADLVEGKTVRFLSKDGLSIPGILYLPQVAPSAMKVPALVWVHGGPGGQSRLNYSPLIQYLVNHGYAVYAINNRGSSGYGKRFYGADDRQHGEADLNDVVESKAMLIGTGKIDPERIGIIGGSYGGYMTLAALAFRPGEFKVGVNIFGVANWLRTLESIPKWWEAERVALYAELGDPVKDKERLMRISPLFHADKINTPLMVLQGANDPRVLKVESDEIVEKTKANGVPVEYLVFPDEGHGFVKRDNEIKAYEGVLRFLDRHLKGELK